MLPVDPALVPDLLHPLGALRIDASRTKLAIGLAFAGGTAGGLFGEALESAQLFPSTWEPSGFAHDLFLQRFVTECFKIRIGRYEPVPTTSSLLRLLAHPPASLEVVHYRRRILSELCASPTLRERCETLYLSLCRLRTLIENTGAGRSWDANQRQIDILTELKNIVEQMSSGFAQAESGLRRLAAFGERVRASEAYRALTDLLRYDSRLGTVTLRVGVGADGRIRGFETVAIAEDTANPFVSPPWRRWLARFELFVRGYSFGQGEVMARLLDAVFSGLEGEVVSLVQLVGDLEFYLGALGFRDRAREAGLDVCLPDLTSAGAPRNILGLFNPLLLMSGVRPVPCDITSAAFASTVLLTGPNSGGKTRLLQSLGFAQLMAQSGLFIPARSGALALSPGLVVSLIEENKPDQSEGRLGMELVRIRTLFERLPPGAMVLLDELCSGTNPSEGEEIFELVVSMLARLRPQAFITTHFLTFAARLERERKIPHLGFLQVELGADRRPTYQFTHGVAGSSLAGHTAERLGVTGEQLSSLVEQNLRRHAASTQMEQEPARCEPS
jgi:DNA mismatch repair protein MutS2